ncbi:MAG: HNH endonuclease [Nanoarchaeota archaeon]|nr:HNH endonuclease [Nanoarchaeota archaeon]
MVFRKGNIPHNKNRTRYNYKPLRTVGEKVKAALKQKDIKEKLRQGVTQDWKNMSKEKYEKKCKNISIGLKKMSPQAKKNQRTKLSKMALLPNRIALAIKNLPKDNFGEKNGNWHNGASFELYGIKFNNKLKEQIRKRDGFNCQECSTHQNKLKQKLSIHHINYNKKDNRVSNLISLCRRCHSQTNSNRKYWIERFQKKQIGRRLSK